MCDRNPVRDAFNGLPLQAVESACKVARDRQAKADDPVIAGIYQQITAECEAELHARHLVLFTKDVIKQAKDDFQRMQAVIPRRVN